MKYPGVLLLIEVGYKFRFFGEDAEVSFTDTKKTKQEGSILLGE